MQLTPSLVHAYVKLVEPRSAREVNLRLVERLAVGREHWRDIFVVPDVEGVSASMRLDSWGDGRWFVVARRRPGIDDRRRSALRALVREVTDELGRREAVEAVVRISEAALPGFERALRESGWHLDHVRLAFDAPVVELPHEVDSPFTWRSLAAIGYGDAVDMLGRVAEGDPAGDCVRSDPDACLAAWLADPPFVSGPECVEIGFLRGEPIAFCMAQANADTGGSRVTYMGLLPAARGQRLSRWVHRRGFHLIRVQGGTRYEGGADETNGPMIHLLRTHGCRERDRIHAWKWLPNQIQVS